jgi:hypothetical protein
VRNHQLDKRKKCCAEVLLASQACGAVKVNYTSCNMTQPVLLASMLPFTRSRLKSNVAVFGRIVETGLLSLLLFVAMDAWSGTLHVSKTNPHPLPPYATWETAAATIQDAVNLAATGDTVLVTNGIYDTGGFAISGTMTNRVVVTNGITLRSVNGPEVTWIVGAAAGGFQGNGNGAIRCISLGASNATLIGFTLTNGHTRTSGNDFEERYGGGIWAHPFAVASNCVFVGNAADNGGGGAWRGNYYDCRFASNYARFGGGTLSTKNFDCKFEGNTAHDGGGGAAGSTSYRCVFAYNSSTHNGGGVNGGQMFSCVVNRNSSSTGGGVAGGVHYNCTIVQNRAVEFGGGVLGGTFYNSIIYDNVAPYHANYSSGLSFEDLSSVSMKYCCTSPWLPGEGNITVDPSLASISHLSSISPCIGAGSSNYSKTVDFDGQAWSAPPCIGADQYLPASTTGGVEVGIEAVYTNVAVGGRIPFQARIRGQVAESVWNFGDGTVTSNRLSTTHAWTSPGQYVVKLTAFNGSHSSGQTATVQVHVVERPVHFVALTNTTPVFPFLSWATAATNVQDAISADTLPGRLVLVAPGVYSNYFDIPNLGPTAVALSNIITVQSIAGPEVTRIDGSGIARGARVGNHSILSGFTLANGRVPVGSDAAESGGGIWCEPLGVITNCVVVSNSAYWKGSGVFQGIVFNSEISGNSGGGAVYQAMLTDCTISSNLTSGAIRSHLTNCNLTANSGIVGGGAYASLLSNCNLTANSSQQGGGAHTSLLLSCDLLGNSARNTAIASGGGAYLSQLFNCNVQSNYAVAGGGVAFCTNYSINLSGNSATNNGGGALGGLLLDCTIAGNTAGNGGGVSASTVSNGLFTGNSAVLGGGAENSRVLDSLLLSNVAQGTGGGGHLTRFTNCSLAFNVATNSGGAASASVLFRCTASNNWAGAGGATTFSSNYFCRLLGNTASTNGGAVRSGITHGSLIVGNTAGTGGGGFQAVFNLSTISSNVATTTGGGVWGCTVSNSITYFNTAPSGANYTSSTFTNSCSTPLPVGTGNKAANPAFVNDANGNWQLRLDSPCIDAITNLPLTITNDLSLKPRPLDGNSDGLARFDMGAYEFDPQTADSNADGISDYWCIKYGFDPFAPAIADGNPDNDAFTTFQEWIADTNPTNGNSFFQIESIAILPGSATIYFQSASNRVYTLYSSANLEAGSWAALPGRQNIPGTATLQSLTDTNGISPGYYRIRVALP